MTMKDALTRIACHCMMGRQGAISPEDALNRILSEVRPFCDSEMQAFVDSLKRRKG